MRLNITLALLMIGFFCPFPSYASDKEDQPEREYVKLIEEGKTWEYIHNYSRWGTHSITVFQMCFDGTETRNGIVYNKLVYCGNLTNWKAHTGVIDDNYVTWWEDAPRDITSCHNDNSAYFLMREENGKVYLYIRDLIENKINSDDFFEMRSDTQGIGDESIIYDFTKEEGGRIDNLFCNCKFQETPYPFDYAAWIIQSPTVTQVLKINIQEFQLIKNTLSFIYKEGIFSCMESIGTLTSGFLPFIDATPFMSGGENSQYYLNCLYGKDGEMIYKSNSEGYPYIDVAKIIEMADMEAPGVAPFIERNGCEVKAENAEITLYDLSGQVVDSGFETVSTTSLQPGVYIAKAQSPTGISTLKLKVD